MNNLLIPTIRFGVIAVIALFVLVGEVFAAPVLTPATATTFSATSVTLRAEVLSNIWRNIPVWFEWGEAGKPMVTVGLTNVFKQGPFETRLTDLKSGVTYAFRAAVIDVESNTRVYSETAYFVIRGGEVVLASSAVTLSSRETTQAPSINTVSTTNTTNTDNTSTSDTIVARSVVQEKKVSKAVVKKATVAQEVNKNCDETKTVAITNVRSNGNAASVIAIGGVGVMPNTLIEWVALIVALLFVVLLIRMIIESNEKKEKAH